MREEGNQFEHYIRDEDRFASDEEYAAGWIAGEAEGKRLQDQALAVGNVATGVYQGRQIQREVDKQTDYEGIAQDAVKGVDAAELESLQQ